MSDVIDNASFTFGFACAEIEFSFGTPRRREAWLEKIGATKSRTPDGKQEIWSLPDGAYARFNLPGSVETWKAAGQALARHIAAQIAMHEKELAQPPVDTPASKVDAAFDAATNP